MERTQGTGLQRVLSEQAREEGFWIREVGDQILELWRGEEFVARFSQTGATIAALEHKVGHIALN